MISSGSDFFPVGYKVRMPNIQHRSGSVNSNKVPTNLSPRKRTSTGPPPHSHARRDINQLSKFLTFADDVVSQRSPNSVTYTKAREGAHSLYKPSDLDVSIGSHLKKSKGVVGRHDCRGELKRHVPCHLQLDDPNTAPRPGTQWNATPGPLIKRDHSTLSQRNSHGQFEENFFLSRVKSVAPSSSVPWQEQTLTKVSSSTARHLIGLPSMDSLDDNHRHVSYKRAHQNTLGVGMESIVGGRITPGGEEDDLPRPKNFVRELKSGAKPVHLIKGDGNTIVLTNNARFNKVLQPSYPHPPSHWHAAAVESSKAGGTSAVEEEEEEDGCVVGYRRWSDFPQRAKVQCVHVQYTCTCYTSVLATSQQIVNE